MVAQIWIVHMEVVKWRTGGGQGFKWCTLVEWLWFQVVMIAELKRSNFHLGGKLDAIKSGISALPLVSPYLSTRS